MSDTAADSDRKRYDAFISYSHTADSKTAERLQYALQRLAKPWYRLRGMRVFRDETDLSVAPEGWPSIRKALDGSRFFLLLASKGAAASDWVSKEVDYWLESRSANELFIILTDGEVLWDNERSDFDWERTTALPKDLAGKFDSEPFWVDLRWAQTQPNLTLRNPKFLKAMAKLAAPVRGLEVDKLVNDDHRHHRRAVQLAYSVGVVLIMLLSIALWQFQARQATAERERDQRVLSAVARTYQMLYLSPLQAVDEAYGALEVKRTPEGEEALRSAMAVARHRRENYAEEAQLSGAGAGYLMERWREGEVFTKLRRDGRYLIVASERGRDGPDPPGTVYLVSLDNLRTTRLLPGDDARGRRLEYMGFSTSGREVFVARQFYLDIFDLDGNLKSSVQLEYHAKPTHLIAGMFGSWILFGDTVGHVMLADTLTSTRQPLDGGRHGDATLFIEGDRSGTLAIVVFESGRADLVVLNDIGTPLQFPLKTEAVIFAAFSHAAGSNRFLTATESGVVDVWEIVGDEPTEVCSFTHGSTRIGIAAFSEDESRVITLNDDDSFQLWDIGINALVANMP